MYFTQTSSYVSLLLVIYLAEGTGGLTESHVRFPAVPWCPAKSGSHANFYDAQRNLCVSLGSVDDAIAPHSAPCPPGSGRREDEFLCRGQIDTAFEVKCQHSSNVLPTRPYFANMDYQCIRSLAYVARPKRCPDGFKLKKLADRWGTVIGRTGTVCIAIVSRLAEVVPIDPITVESCRFVPYNSITYSMNGDDDELGDYEDDIEFEDDEYDSGDGISNVSLGPPTSKSICARVSTSKMVRCPPEAKLRHEEDGLHCVTKAHVPAEFDPVGCKEKFWWSSEFQMCVSIKGYIPNRTCPWGTFWPWYRRSGVTRRQRNAPRYYGDETNPERCLADTALPDNPYCPEGYWLELHREQHKPLCIPEETFKPSYNCEGLEGTIMIMDEGLERPVCELSWDPRIYVQGPQHRTKRQKKNTQEILKKPAATPVDIISSHEELMHFNERFKAASSSDAAWQEALSAALELLRPMSPEKNETLF